MHASRARKLKICAWALAGILPAAAPAWGQVDLGGGDRQRLEIQRNERLSELEQLQVDNRLRANQDVPVGQRALIDYGGYFTFNYLSLDDRQNDTHVLRQYDLVLYGRVNLDAANEVFLRGRTSYQDFNPGDNFNSHHDRWVNPDLERGYYRFDLQKYEGAYKGKSLGYNLVVEGGRDLVYWANGLTMGQVIDGAMIDLNWGALDLNIVAGVTPVRTVDIDTSRPSFDHNTRRGFYGAMLSANLGTHRPFIYYLVQRDYNPRNEGVLGGIPTRFSYNSAYLGLGSTGSINDHLMYGAELVYEQGNTLSNSFEVQGFSLKPIQQTRDDIRAAAADFKLDYLLNDTRNTRFSAELVMATGDSDRGQSTNTFNGNKPNTSDMSFNGFGLVNTGLAFSPEVSNLLAVRLGASTFPLVDVPAFKRLQVGADFFMFEKFQRHGAFDERTSDDFFLGVEPDVYLNWQITSDITLALRYGIFFPSHTLVSHKDPRQFVYGGITFAF